MALGKKCFTFTWKLENVSYCSQQKGECINSPSFVVDAIDETKWHLSLYPRGIHNKDYVGLYLFRDEDSRGADKVEILYELIFVVEDGSVAIPKQRFRSAFPRNRGDGYSAFLKREDVIARAKISSEDTLTVRCRMWKSAGEMTEDIRCHVCTCIRVQEKSILWKIKNFSSFENGKRYTFDVKSFADDEQLISLNLTLVEGFSSEEIIYFGLSFRDQAIRFSTLRLCIIDASENKIECNQEGRWFGDGPKSKEFTFCFSKNKVMAMKCLYLPDDILSMVCEWVFTKEIVLKEIEDSRYACIVSESKFHSAQNAKPLSYSLNDNLKSLCDVNFLCDVKLQTSTRTFSAHKLILSAASPVFKAMFSSDMKEKRSGCVHIEDLNDDTVSRMLVYIYTGITENLTWKSASHLYAAADKYAIFSLKTICSSYLKDNLSPSNACEVLMLSEFQADADLKSTIQAYILKHARKIVNSEEWHLLLETNAKLASDTLSLLYK